MFRRKGDLDRQILFVLGHGHEQKILQVGALKFCKTGQDERLRKLAGAIRPKVEKNNGIAVGHLSHRTVAVNNDGGRHLLVKHMRIVRCLDRFQGIGERFFRNAVNHGLVGKLRPLPMIITIHAVESPCNRGDRSDAYLPNLIL